MSNYDEAIKIVDKIYNGTNFTKEELQPLIDYLNESETTEKEHEALNRDVVRYFELKQGIPPLEDEMNYQFAQKYRLENEPKDECYFRISNEYYQLEEKLTKVGKEE